MRIKSKNNNIFIYNEFGTNTGNLYFSFYNFFTLVLNSSKFKNARKRIENLRKWKVYRLSFPLFYY